MGPNTDGRNEREPSEWKGAEAGGVGGPAECSRAADPSASWLVWGHSIEARGK